MEGAATAFPASASSRHFEGFEGIELSGDRRYHEGYGWDHQIQD
jgi:hypothetical protein